jgi:hypothetical protein
MTMTTTLPDARQPSSRASRFAVIAGTALAVALVATVLVTSLRSTPSGSVVPAVSPAVESAWGLRATQLAMSADRGLVDFRFIVLDADKAFNMFQDVNNLPVLRVEGSGKVLRSVVSMATKHDLAAGRTYFLLYRDDAGAVKRGTRVTILFHDGSKIEHVVAR